MKHTLSVLFIFHTLFATAKELPQKINEFIGITQFVEGHATLYSNSKKTPKNHIEVHFKSFFHKGDTLQIKKSSDYVKVITKSKCIGIFYGPSKVIIPKVDTTDLTWQIKQGSSRWICPRGEQQNIIVNDNKFVLNSGEVLFHKQQLQVRKGQLSSNATNFLPHHIYKLTQNHWTLQSSTVDVFKNYKFQNALKLPKESLPYKKPKSKIQSRWVMGPLIGGGNLNHEESAYSMDSYNTDEGFRLLTNFRYRNWDVIATITLTSSRHPDEEKYSCGNSDPTPNCGQNQPENIHNTLNNIIADVGIRFSPNRSWSFFTKVGIGMKEYQIDRHGLSYGTSYLTPYISGGIDKYFDIRDWFGIYMSAEYYISRTLMNTEKYINTEHCSGGCDPSNASLLDNQDGAITDMGLVLFIGPMLNF